MAVSQRFRSLSATCAAAALLAAAPLGAQANDLEVFDVPIQSRVIETFRIGSGETRFGPLEFAGGLEVTSTQRHFGAVSGLAVTPDQDAFVAVADTGFWIRGRLERDGVTGQLTGLQAVSMAAIKSENGDTLNDKWLADAESVIFDGDDSVIVSFEREHRIERHTHDPETGFFARVSGYRPPVPMHELRRNRGFEGIAIAPETGTLASALVGISEKSLDRDGNLMGFVTRPDGSSFEFSMARLDGFDATDLAFLPDGDLVVLERRFSVETGVAMRLRRIDDADISSRQTVTGTMLFEADMNHQIDNMEALSITSDDDGTPRLTLASDDNHSLLQRNLILEFRLPDAPGDR